MLPSHEKKFTPFPSSTLTRAGGRTGCAALKRTRDTNTFLKIVDYVHLEEVADSRVSHKWAVIELGV